MKPNDVIGDRFIIERQAGSGGMGVVHRARDRHSGETVAVKVLRAGDRDDVARFLREAKVLAELRHPAIVRYVAHGATHAGEPYLAMEWLEGQDLFGLLRQGAMPVAHVVALVRRAAGALAEAHARGVVHRDIKPSNLFLVDSDPARATVLDFGVARLQNLSTTRSGIVVGTPGYMSPEQARGASGVDARSDVFSLGCVAFECLTGAPPFAGEHVMAILAKVLLEEAPRVRALREDVPAALDALVARLLCKDPAGRPEDGAAVERALATLEQLGDVLAGTLPPRSMPASLGRDEVQVFSVVLARARGTGENEHATAPTLTPEQAFGMLEPARAAVNALGGRVEALVDGSLIATVSGTAARGAASDRAAVAARCALAMRGVRSDLRVALSTGRGEMAERLLVGAVVDRAAALLAQNPQSDDVRLDDVTAGLLDARFDVRGDEGGLFLRGEHERIEAARTLLGRKTPCVGRERDLNNLVSLFEECVSEPVARAVLITGPSGIGKSRLRHELQKAIGDRADIWLGRGDVVSHGSPFGLLSPAIRRLAGVLEGEPLEVRRRKLRARVRRSLGEREMERVAAFLGELIGTPFDEAENIALRSARADPMLMGDQMRRAWEDFLAAETRLRPVLVLLEDLHWGDLPSVKLVELALRNLRDRPWMVVAFARSEVHSVFPELWADRELQEIRLGELTRKASEKLVRAVLGDGVPSATMARILERAAGNPFYLEELVRAVAAGKDDTLPETVVAMVQARLDALDGETRRVMRAASVFGQVFWERGVSTLVQGDEAAGAVDGLRERPSVLVDREVVVRVGVGRFGAQEHAFRHSAVREAAYATLTEQDRTLGHRLAAEWLERAGEQEAVVLAEHYERGGDPSRAASWYASAARQALEANDLQATIARAEKGVRCGAEGELRGELRAIQADAYSWRAEHAESARHAHEAMSLLPRGSARWFTAAAELAVTSQRLGEIERLREIARLLRSLWPEEEATTPRAVAMVRVAAQLLFSGQHAPANELIELVQAAKDSPAARDPEAAGWLQAVLAIRETLEGKLEAYLMHMQSAVSSYELANDVRNVCLQRANVGYGWLEIGLYAQAEHSLRESIATADRMALRNVSTAARTNLGLALARQGRLHEGRDIERTVADELALQGDHRMEGSARTYAALIGVLAGDFDAAEQEVGRAVEVLRDTPPLRSYALAVLARARISRGDHEGAFAAAEEAMTLLRSLGGLDDGESFVRLVHAEALEAVGRVDAARDAFLEARERILSRASSIVDESLRESYLKSVPEHARTLSLSERFTRAEAPSPPQ